MVRQSDKERVDALLQISGRPTVEFCPDRKCGTRGYRRKTKTPEWCCGKCGLKWDDPLIDGYGGLYDSGWASLQRIEAGGCPECGCRGYVTNPHWDGVSAGSSFDPYKDYTRLGGLGRNWACRVCGLEWGLEPTGYARWVAGGELKINDPKHPYELSSQQRVENVTGMIVVVGLVITVIVTIVITGISIAG